MPVKIGALIKSLSGKMKLNQEDEKLKPLFALDTEIDDEFANAFEQGLMTEDAAVANTKIRNKIRAEVFNGMDAVIEELMGDYEFDDASKDEVKNGGTAFQKQKLIAKKIADLQDKKAGSHKQKDKEAIQKQIDELNQTLVKTKADHLAEIEGIKKAGEDEVYDIRFLSKLENKKYYTDEVPVSVHAMTAKQLINQALAKNGAKLVYDKALKDFKILNAETGVDFHDPNNKKLSPDEFIDGVLAESKMLKTSSPGPEPGPNPPFPTPAPGGDKKDVNYSMLNSIDAQLGQSQ